MQREVGEITRLLHRWRDGSIDGENELFRRVMPQLRRLAHYFMKGERKGHSLQSEDLVNQIYFKLVAAKDRDWESRRHFFAIAARAMRRYLIDHIRRRPHVDFLPLDEVQHALPAERSKLELALLVDTLLDELEKTEPELCSVVELKFFLGLGDEEAARALGLSLRTFQRMWQDARRWLFGRIEADDVAKHGRKR